MPRCRGSDVMHTEKAPRARGFLVKNMPTWQGVEVWRSGGLEVPRCRDAEMPRCRGVEVVTCRRA